MLLSPKQVAARLAVSRNTALKIMRFDLPHVRVGERIRVKESDLEGYIKKNTERALG